MIQWSCELLTQGEKMRYFKNFAVFCSGLAAFSGTVFLLLRFSGFDLKNVEEELGLIDKLKLYFSKTDRLDNFLMLLLVAFFVLSVAAACALPKIPCVSFFFTLPPLALAIDMFKAEKFNSSPMMYIILAVIAAAGALFSCLGRDKKTGGRQGAIANSLAALLVGAFCFYVWYRQRELVGLDAEESLGLNFFDFEIYTGIENADFKILLIFAIVYAAIAVVLLLLGNIYFIGPCLTLPPAAAAIYLWSAEKISAHAEVVVTLSVVAFLTSLVCALLGVAVQRKRD